MNRESARRRQARKELAQRQQQARRRRQAFQAAFELLETRRMLTAFAYTGSIQTYTVPSTGLYEISAAGAQGGGYIYVAGTPADLGAALTGEVELTAGTTLDVVVGGAGSPIQDGVDGGGGGGSFIFVPGASQPLLAAGGGGGNGYASASITGEAADAQLGDNGGSTTAAAGGTNGNGGSAGVATSSLSGVGGGGAGWLGNGGTGQYPFPGENLNGTGGDGPPTFAGGAGPDGITNIGGSPIGGGFGGGGGPSYYAGGGGGGYSGGAGGGNDGTFGYAGGGGSYFGSSVTNTTGVVDQTGNGAVGITGVLVVSPLTFAVSYERSSTLLLTSNDPGNTVTYGIVTPPQDGTLSNFDAATGTVTYTPQTGFTGTDTFTFKVSDGTTTSTNTVTLDVGASTGADWMSTLSDTVPLSQVSLPGTVQSESGPGTDQVAGLDSALLGTGSDNVVSTGAEAESDEALHITSSLTGAAISTLAATGVNNTALTAAGVVADAAATTADAAQGVDGSNSGVGLALSLASDGLTEVSDGYTVQQLLSSKTTAADDGLTTVQTALGETAATAAAADHTAAATADGGASTVDATAGTENTAAATDDGAADALNGTAGGDDTTAAALDGTADGADLDAEAQGGVDPVADGVAAAADGVAASEDSAAAATDGAADASDVTADAADGTAAADDGAATASNNTAVMAGNDAGDSDTTQAEADSLTADLQASATAHSSSATSDALTAAGMAASAAGDGYTASQFYAYYPGLNTTATTGGNANNIALQQALYTDAVAEASTHTASAVAETTAAVADTVATGLDAAASAADNSAVTAVNAEVAANQAAADANQEAVQAVEAAEAADESAAADEGTAATEDAAAIGGNTAAAPLDAAAGVADGVDAGANSAAAAADIAAIALDATALATVEIPIVDAITAAAAAAGEVTEVALDGVSDGADTAAEVTDTAAIAPDGAAAGLDATAVAGDATAATAAAKADEADAAAVAALEKAATADATADAADDAMLAALDAADTANSAADTADTAANAANAAASGASAAASSADVAFTTEATTVQTIETSVQTQTLSVPEQLNAGVRSLDLQAQQVNDTININAGQYFTGATLQDTLNDVTSFLQANPSETVVITLGNENAPVGSANSFNTDLDNLLKSSDTAVPGTTYDSFVYSSTNASQVPDLGAVRGKIVFVPNADKSWTPSADPTTGQQIGWQPTTQIVQNSATDTDPNARWNDAETGGANGNSGLFATDVGDATTLYTNDLNLDNSFAASVTDTTSNGIPSADFTESGLSPVESGDDVDAIGDTFFGTVQVSRTTGIVGIDDPDQTLITEIADENQLPIMVTSDSDNPADAGTLRDAIIEANATPGFNTIEFAPQLTGPTGNTIFLQSNLPAITNDLVVAGPVTVVLNGFTGFNPSSSPGITGQGSMHTVSETDLAASDSGTDTPTTYTDPFAPQYVDNSGVTVTAVDGPVVDPIDITYGTTLSNGQLIGSEYTDTNGVFASVPGTFTFTNANVNGSLPHAGDGQLDAVTFKPSNTNLNPSYTTVTVNVAKVTPTIPSLPSVSITYGTALANSQLAGFTKPSGISGTYAYTTAAGSLLRASSAAQTETVTFVPTDTTDYKSVSATVNVHVAQATPTVTAVSPVDISYGTPLNNTQLSGTATATVDGSTVTVPGTFTYKTADGTTLSGGNGQIENVTFTPADTTDYKTVASTVTVNVAAQDVPTIVSVNPVDITYGTVLNSAQQLSGTATYVLNGVTLLLPGKFTYTTAEGTLLRAGQGYTENVTFTPTDTTDYTTATSTVTVNVARAVATIQDPVNITYGTALDDGQLQGTATFLVNGQSVTVPGTFAYVNDGAVLPAGNGQSQPIVFTPADSVDYAPANASVTVNVAQATPTLSYTVAGATAQSPQTVVPGVAPLDIEYTTALANNVPAPSPLYADNQLDASATYTVGGNVVEVPGVLSYTSAAGTVLTPGDGQVEAVTFTPTDTTDYTTVQTTVTVNVAQLVPTVTLSDGTAATSGGTSTSYASYSNGFTGSPQPATGAVLDANGNTIGTPVISYYLASDTTLSNPLPAAPTSSGNYLVVGTFAAPNADYLASGDTINFTITPPATPLTTTTTVADAGGTYNGTPFAATAQVNGADSLEGVSPTFAYYAGSAATGTPLAGAPSAPGTYTVVASFPGSADYATSSSAPLNFSIDEAPSLVVTTNQDVVNPTDGLTSLREAIAYADALGGNQTITFASNVTGTIVLGGTQLELDDTSGTLTIQGPGANVLSVSGNGQSDVFQVDTAAEIDGLTVTDGHNQAAGGGIVIEGGSALTLRNDAITLNTAGTEGGGILDQGQLTIIGSAVTGNQDGGTGGSAIRILTRVPALIENSTFADNGPNVFEINVGSITLDDDTLALNGSNDVEAVFPIATTVTLNDTIVDDGLASVVVTSNNSLVGGNPLLGTLGDYGGTTETIPLLPGSPAIGAGAPIAGITTDQTGYARSATAPSIGAYESEGFTITATGGGGQSAVPLTPFATGLGVRVSSNNTLLSDLAGGVVTFTAPATGAGATFGTNPITLAADGTGGTTPTANGTPGTYSVTATASGITNAATFTLTNAKLTPTITVTDNTGVYNGLPFTATSTVNGTPNAAVVYSYFYASDTSFQHQLPSAPTTVGSYLVIAVYNGNATDNAVGAAASFNITPAQPTVAVTAGGGVYTGSAIGATATVAGLSGTPAPTLESVAPTLLYYAGPTATGTGTGAAPLNVGTYTVVATFPGSADYAAASASTTFSITPAAPVVTVSDAGGTYNGSPFSATGTVTGVNGTNLGSPYYEYFLASDTTFSSPSSTAPTAAGNYVAIGFSPANPNYVQVGQAAYFSIAKAPTSVTVGDASGTYNGLPFFATGTVTGAGGLSTTPTFSFVGTGSTSYSSATAPTNAGTYAVTATYAGDANHTGNAATVAFTIGQATPTLTVTDAGGVYNALPYAATGTTNGVNGTPLGSPTYRYYLASDTSFSNPTTTAPTNVGSYVLIALSPINANYVQVGQAVYFNITPAQPTVAVTANGGTYTGSPIGATATVAGVSGLAAPTLESVAPTFTYYTGSTATGAAATTAPTNAGTYTVVASFPGSTDYAAASASKTFTIAQATSAVTVADAGGTYNGSPFAATGTVTGAGALSTTPAFAYVGTGTTSYSSATAPTSAGTYAVTATYGGDANHTGSSASVAFTIAQATPSIGVTDAGGVYDAAPYAATGTTTGVNGTSLGSPTYRYYLASDTSFANPTTTAPTNVGSYVLIALSPVNPNYVQVGVAVYFSIEQASSVLTPVATTVAYGGSTTLSATLKTAGGALLAGRTVTFSVNGKAIGTAVTNAAGVATIGASVAGMTPGVYGGGIAVSFAGDGNSTATSATASLTVLDAPIASAVGVSNLLSVATVSGSFTQARSGAAAGDFVATVNWGDGTTQQLLVVADPLHPGQFDVIATSHVYLQLNQTVTVTINTVGKFGAVVGAVSTLTTKIVA